MKSILIYSDSLTWGIIPNTRDRLPFDKRWPGVFEAELITSGQQVRVIENCLNGRRTVWDDPFKPGRNGSEALSQAVEMHSPLSIVVIMLGTNDFQSTHNNDAWMSAQGVAKLISVVRNSPIEPGMPMPKILVVAPPEITNPMGAIASKFKGAERRYVGFPEELEKVAFEQGVLFFDSNKSVRASAVDGIHLDEMQHVTLGKAMASEVLNLGVLAIPPNNTPE